MQETLETEPAAQRESAMAAGIDASEFAAAASTQARITVPLNLKVWDSLPADQQEQLAWFHQVALNESMNWEAAEAALEYDRSTIFRVLKGTYGGSWEKVIIAIKSYRKLYEKRGKVQSAAFSANRIYRQVEYVLDYTIGSEGCTMLLGEAGVGKTICAKEWQRHNNHGRTVLIEALPIGGAKGLLKQIASVVGVGQNLNLTAMLQSVIRAFNRNRILIIDEIQHHLPVRGGRPVALETIRRIRDLSGCSLCYMGTVRVRHELENSGNAYMYEQITGRTSKPFFIPSELTDEDVLPIVRQYIKRPSDKLTDVCVAWANDRSLGRLRYVVENLRFASRIASDKKRELDEQIIFAAHQIRETRNRGGGL